jgi:predicted dienelactone hydrolase
VLQSLPEVDPRRIGSIGHSLGGHNTLFVAAFDRRIKAMVTSCGFNSFRFTKSNRNKRRPDQFVSGFDRHFGHWRKISELIHPYLPVLHFPVSKARTGKCRTGRYGSLIPQIVHYG